MLSVLSFCCNSGTVGRTEKLGLNLDSQVQEMVISHVLGLWHVSLWGREELQRSSILFYFYYVCNQKSIVARTFKSYDEYLPRIHISGLLHKLEERQIDC